MMNIHKCTDGRGCKYYNPLGCRRGNTINYLVEVQNMEGDIATWKPFGCEHGYEQKPEPMERIIFEPIESGKAVSGQKYYWPVSGVMQSINPFNIRGDGIIYTRKTEPAWLSINCPQCEGRGFNESHTTLDKVWCENCKGTGKIKHDI